MGRARSAWLPAEFGRIAHSVSDEPPRRFFGNHRRPRIARHFLRFTASLKRRYPHRLSGHAQRTPSCLQTKRNLARKFPANSEALFRAGTFVSGPGSSRVISDLCWEVVNNL